MHNTIVIGYNINKGGKKMIIKRGQIWIANLNILKNKNSIQQGIRPIVIVSNEKCNIHSSVITVVPLTTKNKNSYLPTHVTIPKYLGLKSKSVALTEQIMSLDVQQLIKPVGQCSDDIMDKIENALLIQIDIDINKKYEKLKAVVAYA